MPAGKSKNEVFCFAGFKNVNSTPIPDEFFDVLAVKLSEAELRVLLYIMRRTFGFKKTADAISLSQLTGGIRKRDGEMLDYGTGLSKPAVLKAVSGLAAKNIISIEKQVGCDGRNNVNVYALRFAHENSSVVPSSELPSSNGQASKVVNEIYPASNQSLPTLVSKSELSLPLGVKLLNKDGKTKVTRVVNSVYKQVNSLQDSSYQNTVNNQQMLWATGALALQENLQLSERSIDINRLSLALTELGLSAKIAHELMQEYSAKYLWEKIELTRHQVDHQPYLRNTAGYLRRAIEDDYQAEKPSKEKNKFEFAQRFVNAVSEVNAVNVVNENYPPPKTASLPPIHRSLDLNAEKTTDYSSSFLSKVETQGASYDAEEASEFPSSLWQETCDDMVSRYRLDAVLPLLKGSSLCIEQNQVGNARLVVNLASVWQERQLGIAARSTIKLVLRQRFGPGYELIFKTD